MGGTKKYTKLLKKDRWEFVPSTQIDAVFLMPTFSKRHDGIARNFLGYFLRRC